MGSVNSIKNKLIFVVVVFSLVSSGTVMIFYSIANSRSLKKAMINNSVSEAIIIGQNSIGPLVFNDRRGGSEILNKLTGIEGIRFCCLFDSNQMEFARYGEIPENTSLPDLNDRTQVITFNRNSLHIFLPINYQGAAYGSIYMIKSTDLLEKKIQWYWLTGILFASTICLIAFILVHILQRSISNPIISIKNTVENISENEDFSIRVRRKQDDEIGSLYQQLNRLFGKIEIRQLERISAEEELREQKEFSDKILDTNPNIIYIYDVNIQRIIFVNRPITIELGFPESEFSGDDGNIFGKLIHPMDFDQMLYSYSELFESSQEKIKYIEFRMKHKNGEWNWFQGRHTVFQQSADGTRQIIGTAQDITPLKKAEIATKESEDRFRKIFTQAAEAIFILHCQQGNYLIHDLNFAAVRMAGYPEDKLKQQNFLFLIPESRHEQTLEMFEWVQSGNTMKFESLHRNKRDVNTDIEISARKIKIAGFPYIYTIVRDITSRKKAESDLETLNQNLNLEVEKQTKSLRRINEELAAFSFSVSHDLRTPLRGISGFCDALMEDHFDELTDVAKDYMNRIKNGVSKMEEIINGMQLLSKIGQQHLIISSVDLSEMAAEILKEYRMNDSERKVKIMIQENIMVKGDKDLLKILMWNLLDNAWKFTGKKAKARIEFGQCENRVNAAGNVLAGCWYFVKDNGAGFNMDYYDKIFGAFERLHTDKEFKGTGIGLANVKRVVDRHNGSIMAESIPGSGTVFYFTIDL